ncbi:dTDP-4-dehydrorhamnose 3,5-epimerase [Sphingomonas sp. BHC-A]|uniref:dTDP-4-dehydrorhamnose 3,5-epimerase n=2 Tax=Sphingobium indicum TaxID=332055 RepID=A0A1L5BJK1_SPHIB|nr:dTDP-4-dehydrorhamnose 3,5-epimerase [Sphingobium indicum B90A]KEZ00102.1 dTDP-4-dehydrorhamnose 3,5-epimerase [Sphingomonas sp. BHC-A]
MISPAPIVTPLKRIATPGGEVMHAIKAVEDSYAGFGEAYFSTVEKGAVKGWKRHNRMTLNLVVPVGAVEFVIHDSQAAAEDERFRSFTIGATGDYARLTVPPGLWMAFSGRADGLNLVLNVANIGHDPDEVDRAELDAFPWTFA